MSNNLETNKQKIQKSSYFISKNVCFLLKKLVFAYNFFEAV